MNAKHSISLKELTDKLEESSDSWSTYLNIETGEFISIPDGTNFEQDPILLEKIENSQEYLKLPEQHELQDRQTMMDFVDTLNDDFVIMRLSSAINGPHPYRRFKDTAASFGLLPAYFDFRRKNLENIAKVWCEKNQIQYV